MDHDANEILKLIPHPRPSSCAFVLGRLMAFIAYGRMVLKPIF